MSYYSSSAPSAHQAASPAPSVSADLSLVSSLSEPSTQPALKANAAVQAVEPLARLLLNPPDLAALKVALAGFASAYPFLFRYACQSGDQNQWNRVISLKMAVLQLWRSGSVGGKVGAVKAIQRIVQTQSTAQTADPRLARNPEPNLSLCRPNHPFLKIAALEDESNKLLEECITTLFTSNSADLVSAIVSSLATLLKNRPQYAKLVITSLTNWSPAALAGQSARQIKSVEKVLRLALMHLMRSTHGSAYQSQITDFLNQQATRMAQAAAEAQRRKDEEASKKRQLLASQIDEQQVKRRRLNPSVDAVRLFSAANPAFERPPPSIADLPLETVVSSLIATLQNVSDPALATAIEAVRLQLPASEAMTPREGTPKPEAPAVDPLKLDLGADELDLKAEVPPEPAPEETEEEPIDHNVAFEPVGVAGGDLELSAPFEITTEARNTMILSSLKRVCAAGAGGASSALWVPLVSRLITRGLEGSDEGEPTEEAARRGEALREVLFSFIKGDLQTRTELARIWLNEEWFAARRRRQMENRPYDRWLRLFLEHISAASSNKDKELLQFLMDLPEIPVDEIHRLETMALNADQMQLGFSTLRELVILRPSVRPSALDVLLGLSTHEDKRVRNAAIMTLKKWVPDVAELSDTIVAFAVSVIERLEVAPAKEGSEDLKESGGDHGGEADMAMDATPPPTEPKPPFALVKDARVVDRLDPPTTLSGVTQHVELLLALCVKEPRLLKPLFEHYPRMQPYAQGSLEELIVPLMRALGIKHPGVLELLGDFPAGSDKLVLRCIDILADKSKLPSNIIALIKEVAAKRDLDSRFYAIIVPECGKAEIVRYLPRVISLLDGTPQKKAAIRSIFLSVIAPPAHFSSINSLRTRSDSLTPVELMTYLHKHDKEIGIKNTIEAISICFSMADGFRPEVLAAFMQQIVDEPTLPNLFLRTVIQAVTTYKSLQPFVSTTLLSRLITKKIWTVGPLWEGFIRLAKAIAPNSFAALLQLPKEQLAELVQKQPTMREPLRDYVVKKGGANNARMAAVLEALDEPSGAAAEDGVASSTGGTPAP
ncbi:hypothetical protein NBRC10512_005729 [Rhodotorula toruloides]|uniref:RHTO0S21e00342g1_1 n=2 Tax=Rhodotorula toruloides TaxID=5286 RepID=A0A061BHK5_RHOTO|nr:cleavage and polyadenylation specificity factor [Rhodotorula toruloides NP11]EMS20927.1 cleavage and polyadenylation specificity factor [Rhodotorula toruloides NP11]CDR48857.1 RHTO0S21e00342g1_1 [Rhodotorula toruloides]